MKNANDELNGFIGTENYYRNPIIPSYTHTDGVQHMAETYNAFWLIDLVLSYQLEKKVRKESFQVWELEKLSGDSFNIIATDGNGNEIARQYIPFSDFPYDKITLWISHQVVMLPSEY